MLWLEVNYYTLHLKSCTEFQILKSDNRTSDGFLCSLRNKKNICENVVKLYLRVHPIWINLININLWRVSSTPKFDSFWYHWIQLEDLVIKKRKSNVIHPVFVYLSATSESAYIYVYFIKYRNKVLLFHQIRVLLGSLRNDDGKSLGLQFLLNSPSPQPHGSNQRHSSCTIRNKLGLSFVKTCCPFLALAFHDT